MILELLLFLVPVYVANCTPVILGGGSCLDFGRKFYDKRRIFGKGKTIRGFVGGIVAGTAAGGIIAFFYPLPFFADFQTQFIAAFLLSCGVLAGDAFGSFIKRRLDIASGEQFMPDSCIFLVFSLVFVLPIADHSLYEWFNVGFFFVLTIILHPLTNTVANKLGLKKVPW